MATQLESPRLSDLSTVRTLPALFAWRVALTPETEAYRQYDDITAQWASFTWHDAGERVARLVTLLSGLGLPRGVRIAILLPNGLHAVCLDQAALALGYVPVPMHALDNPTSIAYILNDSDASLLVAASDTQWQAIAGTGVSLPSLRQVVALTRELPGKAMTGELPVLTMEEWLASATATASTRDPRHVAADDLAALVYTSGTTGKPKGVMLTHENVVSNIKAALQRIAPRESDVFLSFLPLSHTFERTAGYYLPIATGSCVAFARTVKQLSEDLRTVKPTILISVPRIYERVFAGIEASVAKSAVKSWLFDAAQAVGWRRFVRMHGFADGGAMRAIVDACAWPWLNALVARPVQNQFGGRLRLTVSGGAPLSQQIARCFLGLGVPVVQGYGMTETSPVVAVNALQDNDPATVGRPLTGVEVRIGENKELQVRGPNVMRGYWKRDDDTARSFVDGWLRTGDQATIEAGRIRILGRLKEIIVTSTGEKIAPVDLELAILADSSFEQAYAFGDNRQFISCVVVLTNAYWSQLTAKLELDPMDPASLNSRAARETVCMRIRKLTRDFPYYAQPRAVILSLEPWSIENTLLTPTLKLKRNNLAAHFADEIEQVYEN
ncbi:AMP-dependent synthetase/ligase [Paraburkholderia phenazinium]|uniref:Long-chain acyl-CoA synthetase n=1 Tax=Paraburkholderia phenazinium TaxID=60549 RepID=A0A1G8JS94_9BURK|nr:long-chain fatty acid--CoA ligase [Paraburkholderia phenazinium]SDI34098.1 long-chain acyl-CoA synthetase [Paraburkholderia phenazinium]